SMRDWKPTDSTGRHQRLIRPVDGSTTLVEAGRPSIVKAVARSRVHFPFGVSGSETAGIATNNRQPGSWQSHVIAASTEAPSCSPGRGDRARVPPDMRP